jgi:hypothetical protein
MDMAGRLGSGRAEAGRGAEGAHAGEGSADRLRYYGGPLLGLRRRLGHFKRPGVPRGARGALVVGRMLACGTGDRRRLLRGGDQVSQAARTDHMIALLASCDTEITNLSWNLRNLASGDYGLEWRFRQMNLKKRRRVVHVNARIDVYCFCL